MSENWRPIPGYEGFYEAGDAGHIRSVPRIVVYTNGKTFSYPGALLRPAVTTDGYLRVSLTRNNKGQSFLVHRLVASAFIANPDNKSEVNHLNGVRADNSVANLEWATPAENTKHAFDVLGRVPSLLGKVGKEHHLSRSVVVSGVEYGSYREAARALGCSRDKIRRLAGLPRL